MAIAGVQVTIPTSGGTGTNGATVLAPLGQFLSCTTVSGSNVLTSSALFGTVGPDWAIDGSGIPAGTHIGQITSTSSLNMILSNGQPANATASGTTTLSFHVHQQRAPNDPFPVVITNTDAANTLYLGGKAVNNTGGSVGFPLKAGVSVSLDLTMDDVVWAIAGTASIVVGILIGRQ